MCVPEPLRTQCSKSSLDFVLSSVISPTQMGPEITKSPLYCGFAAAVSEGALSPLFIRKTTFHSPGPDILCSAQSSLLSLGWSLCNWYVYIGKFPF